MQRIALAAALLALTLALLPLVSASPAEVTVTVTYEVWGGYSDGYTPLDYTAWGGYSLASYLLDYPANGSVTVYQPPALGYPVSAGVSLSARPVAYGALGGASLKYRPLVYGLQPQVVLGNATFRLNVHVRVIKGNKTLVPEFDVPYRVNGTSRVAVKGEDSLDWTFAWVELLLRDPLVLEFPEEVNGYALLNSTPMYADPRVQSDVWIYYGEAPSPAQPPSQPGQQPGAPQPGREAPTPSQPPSQPGQQPEGGGAAPSESPVKRAISEAVRLIKRFLAWVLEQLTRLLAQPRLLLLLLGLLLIALGVYLWWRSRRFVLIIEVRG